jgi:hypothetical protein
MPTRKVPVRVEHTGTFMGDRAQRQTQEVANKSNTMGERLAVLEALLLTGRATIEMRDADQIITIGLLSRYVIRTHGLLTAARNLRGFYRPKNESETYTRMIHNNVTGGFNVSMVDTAGAAVVFGAGATAVVQFTPAGPVLFVL